MTRKRASPGSPESRPDEAGPRLWRTFGLKLAAARLTERQRLFVVQYLAAPCGAKAARAAGYSPNRDRQQAYDNLRKPTIRRLVRQALHLHQRGCYVRAGLVLPNATRIPRHLRYKD